MDNQPPCDRTLASDSLASEFLPTLDGSASADPGAGAYAPAPPVTLAPEAYAVGAEIARGGMGAILAAEDRRLGRVVAMKVMKLHAAASESARSRFKGVGSVSNSKTPDPFGVSCDSPTKSASRNPGRRLLVALAYSAPAWTWISGYV